MCWEEGLAAFASLISINPWRMQDWAAHGLISSKAGPSRCLGIFLHCGVFKASPVNLQSFLQAEHPR